MSSVSEKCSLASLEVVIINMSALITIFVANMLYDSMLAAPPFNLMLKGSLCRLEKSLWLVLVAAEVTSVI
jgi:hypothetical protein